MKKILYLLLISSPVFAMQPNRTTTTKLQEKLVKYDAVKNRRFTFTQAAMVYTAIPSTVMTIIPTPLTVPYLLGNTVIIGAAVIADTLIANRDNNK
jgi:hypothetical protein